MLITAFVAVLGYSYHTPTNHIAWVGDLAKAKAKAAASGKPILMEFSASWCPACRAVKRNVWPLKRVADVVNSQVIPLTVDVDTQKQLVGKYHVNAIPAFIVTDARGRVLARAEGYLDADGVIALIRSAVRPDAIAVPQSIPPPPTHPAAAP